MKAPPEGNPFRSVAFIFPTPVVPERITGVEKDWERGLLSFMSADCVMSRYSHTDLFVQFLESYIMFTSVLYHL